MILKKATVWVWKVLSCTVFSQRMEVIVILSKNGNGINPTGLPLSVFQIMKNYCWSTELSYNDLFSELLPLLTAFLLIGQKCKKKILNWLLCFFLQVVEWTLATIIRVHSYFIALLENLNSGLVWLYDSLAFHPVLSSTQNFNLYTLQLYHQTS